MSLSGSGILVKAVESQWKAKILLPALYQYSIEDSRYVSIVVVEQTTESLALHEMSVLTV